MALYQLYRGCVVVLCVADAGGFVYTIKHPLYIPLRIDRRSSVFAVYARVALARQASCFRLTRYGQRSPPDTFLLNALGLPREMRLVRRSITVGAVYTSQPTFKF